MVSCHQEIAGHSAFSLGMIADFKGPVTSNPFAYRQLFWESGMIGQVLYLAAEAHGLRGTGIGCYFDDAVHEILGLADNQYRFHGVMIASRQLGSLHGTNEYVSIVSYEKSIEVARQMMQLGAR